MMMYRDDDDVARAAVEEAQHALRKYSGTESLLILLVY